MGVRLRLQTLTKSQISTVDSIGKYSHISDQVKAMQEKPIKEGTETQPLDHSIEFKNVNLSYGSKHALKNINLKIKPHTCVVIEGQSGSGKTSLAKTLERAVEPQSGDIWVGKRLVQEYKLTKLKQIVSFVNPDIGILHRSIQENILFGCPEDQLSKKTKEAQTLWDMFAHDVFSGKTMDSPVGPRGGSELSTGQKTMIKLMNMLICGNSPIMIIDEPVNGLDEKTKKRVLSLLDNIRKSRTTTMIIITHDSSCAEVADRHLFMNQGNLIQNQKRKLE